MIHEPGPLRESLLLLGSRQVISYLVKGEAYALIGGGTAWGVARLEEHLSRFDVDRERIRYVVVSHIHHDHCGAVPYLRRKYPWIELVSSAYGAQILAKEKPARLMFDLNHQTLDRLGRSRDHEGISLDFERLTVEHPMADGSVLELGGGLSLRFIDTPGHSRCSQSVYLPELKTLFPGDSLPYPEPGRGDLTVTANHDFSDYLSSLEKLASLSIEIVAYEHGGALAGEEARGIVERGLEAALKQRERIRARLRELGDIGLLVEETAEKYKGLELFQAVPMDALRSILLRMVRSAVGEV